MNLRSQLVLSLFPGIDLLGRAFAAENFSVVRGPDKITGDDIRDFAGIAGRFDGIIGGPPCQGFSSANRYRNNPNHPSIVNSRAMIKEFLRVVDECKPSWFLMENVPAVPDVILRSYSIQRLPISDHECGGVQVRMRHFQFGSLSGFVIRPKRVNCGVKRRRKPGPVPIAITTKPASKWNTFAEQCRRQGLDPSDVSLPGWSKEAKFRAIGNGVSMHVGRVLAAAVKCAGPSDPAADCPCGCGRELKGKQRAATVSCRKRLQIIRETADGRRSPNVIELL